MVIPIMCAMSVENGFEYYKPCFWESLMNKALFAPVCVCGYGCRFFFFFGFVGIFVVCFSFVLFAFRKGLIVLLRLFSNSWLQPPHPHSTSPPHPNLTPLNTFLVAGITSTHCSSQLTQYTPIYFPIVFRILSLIEHGSIYLLI